jgi:hypothetical protein
MAAIQHCLARGYIQMIKFNKKVKYFMEGKYERSKKLQILVLHRFPGPLWG